MSKETSNRSIRLRTRNAAKQGNLLQAELSEDSRAGKPRNSKHSTSEVYTVTATAEPGLLQGALNQTTIPAIVATNGHQLASPRSSLPPRTPSQTLDAVTQSLSPDLSVTQFTAGACFLSLLMLTAGAAPACLPLLYLLFVVLALPQRVYSFCKHKWTFFLVDYCYFANAAVVCFLLSRTKTAGAQAAVYVLAEGPLAGALIPWQCAWVLGSADHTVSTLMHLMPGLALYGQRFFDAPTSGLSHFLHSAILGPQMSSQQLASVNTDQPLIWLCAAPLAFYVMWQFVYWLIVQVIFRRFINDNGYDTSYNQLARRAGRKNLFLYRFIRRGSIPRRIILYGLLQLAFTLGTGILGIATYYSFTLATIWQVIKVVVPLYFGACYQCQHIPKKTFKKGIQKAVDAGLLVVASVEVIAEQESD